MDKDFFLTLIKNPQFTSQNDTPLLTSMVKKYPFFHSAYILLLYNLKKTKNTLFDKQLHESAIYIPNRKHLFNLLHKIESADYTENQSDIITNLIDVEFVQDKSVEILSESPNSDLDVGTKDPDLINKDPGKKHELLEIDEINTNSSNNNKNQDNVTTTNCPQSSDNKINNNDDQKSIIDKFIEENPNFSPKKIEPDDEHQDISLASIQEDENLASETLANIFEMQKLYDKAIDVYKKLILKYPEKSTYFASRIDVLKKITK